jgi:hypothetical protein
MNIMHDEEKGFGKRRHYPQSGRRNMQNISTLKKNAVFWVVSPCGTCKTDLPEEPRASIIRVTRIGELRTMLTVTSN